MSSHRYDTFLSHSGADKPVVEKLAARLRAAGIEPWLDKWNLVPGRPWQPDVEKALNDCTTCSVLIGAGDVGPWQHDEMRAAIYRRVTDPGEYRVIPVLLPNANKNARGVQDLLHRTTWVEFRNSIDEDEPFHRWLSGIRGVEPGPRSPGPADEENPYPGLKPFEKDSARYFFGRDDDVTRLLEMIEKEGRFVAIVGPSGTGKSSLARAGLLPALQAGRLPGSSSWPIVTFRPGHDPLQSLAVALSASVPIGAQCPSPGELIDAMKQNSRELHLATAPWLHGNPDARVVLLADQFEEVFTQHEEEANRKAFVDNLLYASAHPDGQTIVVLTLRADFYGRCTRYADLAQAVSRHQMLLGPLNAEELKHAIVEPAQLVGYAVEPELLSTLIDETLRQEGTLPLLQHALSTLWEQRRGNQLTLDTYNRLGGLAASIDERANEVLESIDTEHGAPGVDMCRLIFLRLVRPGDGTEDTRRQVAMSSLYPAAKDGSLSDKNRRLVADVVDALAKGRLITIRGQESEVEIAHEALIRRWSKLDEWLSTDRAAALLHDRLSEAAREWSRSNEDPSFLVVGQRLEDIEHWSLTHAGRMNQAERNFLEASRTRTANSQRRRRAARLIKAAAFVAIGAAVVLAWALISSEAKNRELAEAHAATNRALRRVELAHAATNLALEKVEQARAETEDALTTSRLLRGVAYCENGDPVVGMQLMAQAHARAVADGDEPTRDAAGRLMAAWSRAVGTCLPHDEGEIVTAVAVGPDSELVLTGSESGRVRLWDIATRSATEMQDRHAADVLAVSFAADGQTLLTGGAEGTIRLWDRDGRSLCTLDATSPVYAVALAPDGKALVAGCDDNVARLWPNRDAAEAFHELRHADAVRFVDFSSSGAEVVTAGINLHRWEVETGEGLGRSLSHASSVLFFGADEAAEITADADGTVREWNLSGILQKESTPFGDFVSGMAVSRDRQLVATVDGTATARVWRREPRSLIRELIQAAPIHAVAFSPRGGFIVTASEDATARVWSSVIGEFKRTVGPGSMDVICLADSTIGVVVSPPPTGISVTEIDMPAKQGTLDHKTVLGGDDANVLKLHSAGKYVVIGGTSGLVAVCDVESAQRMPGSDNLASSEPMTTASFSSDGNILAIAAGPEVKFWRVGPEKVEFIQQTASHDATVSAIKCSADGARVLTGCRDGTARIWEVATGKQIGETLDYPSSVADCAFFDQRDVVVVAYADATAQKWNVADGQPVGERISQPPESARRWNPLDVPKQSSARLAKLSERATRTIRFSDDGRTLVIGRGRGARLLDVETGLPLGPPLAAPDSIDLLTFQPGTDGPEALICVSGPAHGTKEIRRWPLPQWLPDSAADANTCVDARTSQKKLDDTPSTGVQSAD